MPVGQIGVLLDQASKFFHRAHGGGPARESLDNADAALANYGIFANATLDHRVIDAVAVEGGLRTVTVLVTVSVRFEAPDGSSATVRALGQGSGDLVDATAGAAEDALRTAIARMLGKSNGITGNRGSESGRDDVS